MKQHVAAVVTRSPVVLVRAMAVGAFALLAACADGGRAVTEPDVSAAFAKGSKGPCLPDSKLIGRIELTSSTASNAWWGLTLNGLIASGIVTDDAQLATINGWFGSGFTDLPTAVNFLVDQVRFVDANNNNYVCAYSIRGTRTSFGDPLYALTLFKTLDDDR